MIAREDDHKYKKGKCVLRGKSVYYMGVPDGFGPGYLGWDANRPTAHPRLYYNVTFQEDARIDKEMEVQDAADTTSESDTASDVEGVTTPGNAGDDTTREPGWNATPKGSGGWFSGPSHGIGPFAKPIATSAAASITHGSGPHM